MMPSERVALLFDVETSPHFSYAKSLADDGSVVATTSRFIRKLRLGSSHSHFQLDSDRQEDVERFVDRLLGRGPSPLNLLAGTDRHLALAWTLQSAFGESINVCSPCLSTVERLCSKTASRRLFSQAGLPLSPGRIVQIPIEAADVARTLEFPIVVKRPKSESSLGVGLARTLDELRRLIRKAELLGDTEIVVETSVGKTAEISFQFCIDDGRCHPIYALEKLGHLQPSYSTLIRMMSEPELESVADVFRNAGSYLSRGVYSAQLKKDSDQRLVVIEISPRFGNNYRIVNRMLPTLTRHLYAFYDTQAAWTFSAGRLKRSIVGISPVDYFAGCFASRCLAGHSKFHAGLAAAAKTLEHSREAIFDDYIASAFSHPRTFLRQAAGSMRLARHVSMHPNPLSSVLESAL